MHCVHKVAIVKRDHVEVALSYRRVLPGQKASVNNRQSQFASHSNLF